MNSEHTPWFENCHSFNSALFGKIRAIVTSLGVPNRDVDTVDVHLLSVCGSFSWEAPVSVVCPRPWSSGLLHAILSTQELVTALGDFSFSHFSKSDLFRAVFQKIVYPIQVLSDFSPVLYPGKKIALRDEVLIATGIRHSVQNSKGRIDCLRGEIPAADEFYIWSDDLECFADPDKFTLEECIAQIAGQMLEMTEFCGPPLTMQQIGQVASPLLPTPRRPQELWKLHSLMGTLRHGESIA
jgi:hypothetical protein